MCKGNTGNGSVRRRSLGPALVALSRYLECAAERRETGSSCQSHFHLPERQQVIETECGEMMENHHHEVAGGPLCMAESKAKPDAFWFAAAAAMMPSPPPPPPAPHATASWLDVRVIYIRVSGCCCSEEEAPESLSMSFPPRSIGTALELNGGRIAPSEQATLLLKRDRVDPESAEATYLSTDYVRTCSGPLSFQVFSKDELLVVGILEHSERNCVEQGRNYNGWRKEAAAGRRHHRRSSSPSSSSWNMDCICAVGQVAAGGRIVSSKKQLCHEIAMEVCLVGRNLETPVILSQTVPLTAARRRSSSSSSHRQQKNTLDVIPEAEELGKRSSSRSCLMMIDQPRLRTDGNLFMGFSDKDGGAGRLGYDDALVEGSSGYNHLCGDEAAAAAGLGCALEGGGLSGYDGYGDGGDDGQMTWFNAGVRVGVGLGLGMCLGVGIGIGLVVRTYHATARSLRKGFI